MTSLVLLMRKSNMYDRRRNRNTFSPNPWKNRHNLAGLLPTFVPPARRPSARTRQRQTTACGHRAYAKREELEVVEEYYDGDVRGADPIETRPGFSALLDRIEGNGVRTVLVEDASRFARQLIVQEAGITALIERGVRVLTASGDLTATEDPFKVAMRQIGLSSSRRLGYRLKQGQLSIL